MPLLRADRHERILSILAEQQSVRVADLVQLLDVSEMTIHRDLDQLAAQGRLRKVRGGAMLSPTPSSDPVCCVCHRAHFSRTPVVLLHVEQNHEHACCPHCGLVALIQPKQGVISALMTDFLYGRMINCRLATYIVAPSIRLCCTPTVLAFERREDAERFQRGFGGQLLDLQGALAYLQQEMRL